MAERHKVVLTMIVKNEEKVIERCLYSCLRLIDYFVICDTGSTDKTIEKIHEFSKQHNLPGEVHQHEWKDFAHNRNLSLEIAKTKGDYIFWIDADDILEFEPNYVRPAQFGANAYLVDIRYDHVHYKRVHLVNTSISSKWTGVLHESLEVDSKSTIDILRGVLMVIVGGGGGRNTDPEKHQKDAKLLEAALVDDPTNSRYMFYLAQSYRNYGALEKAIEWYQKRADIDSFPEERCYAKYQVGLLKLASNNSTAGKYSESEICFDLITAYDYCTLRIEPLYYALLLLNKNKMYTTAFNLGIRALIHKVPDPVCLLFTEEETFVSKFPFELACSAFNVGKIVEAMLIYLYLYKKPTLSADMKQQIIKNIQVCMIRLGLKEMNPTTNTMRNFLKQVEDPSIHELFQSF